MSKFVRTLDTQAAKASAIDMIKKAPWGWIATIAERKRTNEQNDKMWAMLTDVSLQCALDGRRRPPEEWKVVIMHALGHEQRFLPALDGNGYVPLGYRSSELKVSKMRDLIEFLYAYGAENNVTWSDPKEQAA